MNFNKKRKFKNGVGVIIFEEKNKKAFSLFLFLYIIHI